MENTKIEWATHTWNPWEGCTKVSPGCVNCYAERRNRRFSGGANWGKGAPRRRTSEATWRKPVAWNAAAVPCVCDRDGDILPDGQCNYCGLQARPPRIFPSLCDPFDGEVAIEWVADCLKLIFETQNLDYLLLTKRPENCLTHLAKCLKFSVFSAGSFMHPPGFMDWLDAWCQGNPPRNVWIGASVEDQRRKSRIDLLRMIPAKLHFLSLEPLLEDLGELNLSGIDWVIIGGESGPGARPCHVDWLRYAVEQCCWAGVRCFVKQVGSNAVGKKTDQPFAFNHGCRNFRGDESDLILQHKKGGDPAEWPEDLRVREFPAC